MSCILRRAREVRSWRPQASSDSLATSSCISFPLRFTKTVFGGGEVGWFVVAGTLLGKPPGTGFAEIAVASRAADVKEINFISFTLFKREKTWFGDEVSS